ncbi:ferric enterobactin uptake receptor [Helicobacter sp. MIT 00-7814]|uniref:TonB-dependent receptor domain-containing protein n=1 Tax=unclassified Helicobacter TaxID=2593540 RepID=UPI000E1FAC18|nr:MULTISPECIES: TonB-dependent receptor [unclassified Helicobacter]RDU51889.1 ferric enterobactin uptake receptor [Helicobacter sp. MIT 00-7814]RDU54052.1 ferric enterobactin uptake receptor [Helicobacter sp. MIT 99-10781]
MIHFSKLRTKGAFLLPLSVALSLSLANADELSQSSASPASTSAESTDSKVENMDKVKLQRSVVTATGFKQDIKEAPASISIIDKEEILTRPVRDLGDMVQNVPGVDVSVTKTGDNTISMRGLSYNYTLILIDGKRQNVNGSFDQNGFGGAHSALMPPVEMIERIEVLRGPASVVWGSDAMGGVINIITKKNPDKFTGNIMLETRLQEDMDTWGNMWGANGYVAIPLVKERLSLQLRGKYQDNGANKFLIPEGYAPIRNGVQTPYNYNNPYTTHSPTGYTQWNGGARLNFTPSARNNFYLDYEYNNRVSGTLNTSQNSITSFNTFDKQNLVLNHDGDYEFAKTTTYLQFMQTRRIPHTSSPRVGEDSGVLNWASLIQNRNYVFDSKARKSIDFGAGGFLALNAGIYYMYETFDRKATNRGVLDQHQAAVYVEGDYTPIEYVSVSLGARYNYSDIYKGAPTPRLFVNVNPFSWWTIKAGVAGGYLVPQIEYLGSGFLYEATNRGTTTAYYGNPNLKAERSWNYEIGTIFDTDMGMLTLTAFYNDFNNKVYANNTFGQDTALPNGEICNVNTCVFYQNVDKAYTRGIEAGFVSEKFYGFGINANYTFADSKQLSGANQGDPLNYVSRHSANVRLTYKANRFLDGYVRWQGKFKTPISRTSTSGQVPAARALYGAYYKDYMLVDLGVNYHIVKGLTLSAVVSNLFDVDFDKILLSPNGAYYANQYGAYIPGRNYWISLKYDF